MSNWDARHLLTVYRGLHVTNYIRAASVGLAIAPIVAHVLEVTEPFVVKRVEPVAKVTPILQQTSVPKTLAVDRGNGKEVVVLPQKKKLVPP